jgi:hypothetical protein
MKAIAAVTEKDSKTIEVVKLLLTNYKSGIYPIENFFKY